MAFFWAGEIVVSLVFQNGGPLIQEAVIKSVREGHPSIARAWFKQLNCKGVKNGVMVVEARNLAQKEYLEATCKQPFLVAAQAATGRLLAVEFEVCPGEESGAAAGGLDQPGVPLVKEFCLENFAVGPGSRMAHAAATAAAASPGKTYNPLVIFGSKGLGKTHLLQAMVRAVRERGGAGIYLTAERFIHHCVVATERDCVQDLRSRLGAFDIIAIDDADALAGRDISQEGLFHILEQCSRLGSQFVAAFGESPEKIDGLTPRLRSRMQGGLVAELEAPCPDTVARIVRELAARRCFELPDDVVNFIAARASDGGGINELLINIDRFCESRGGKIDIHLAELSLGCRQPGPATDFIQREVARFYSLPVAEVTSGGRSQKTKAARDLSNYFALRLTGKTIKELAGGSPSAEESLLRSNHRVMERLKSDDRFRNEVDLLWQGLNDRPGV